MSSASSGPQDETRAHETEFEREEKFLRRWSQRKQDARAQALGPALPKIERPIASPEAPVEAPEKILTDFDMPPIESLNENSDFSGFLSAGVSETLRRQALRKLFLLPSINERCPLDSEYHDCHGFLPLGDVVTHEMREEIERVAQKLKEAAAAALLEKNPAVDSSTPTKAVRAREPKTASIVSASKNPPSRKRTPKRRATANRKRS